ncbi:outer membrane beta-barrel protein [Shewanella benthica]|nr:outer membrane beta-barrel protein [Shewanella benthica]
MNKRVVACALTSMLALSASANSSEFTINPMVGASYNKAFGTKAAVGLEAGYGSFLMGYTYSGAEKGKGFNERFEEFFPNGYDSLGVDGSSRHDYKAHTLYLGYQFNLGTGQLALKAGAEFSKLKSKGSYLLDTSFPGYEGDYTEFSYTADSGTLVKPMVGVGYYMNNGLNFNLHYTYHNGDRRMKGSGTALDAQGADTRSGSYSFSGKDLSTVMFTVGYRF